jgi:hypothetical protein
MDYRRKAMQNFDGKVAVVTGAAHEIMGAGNMEKRDGQWRISSRTYVADWTNQFPNGMEALASSGLELNVLKIMQPDHGSYRPL